MTKLTTSTILLLLIIQIKANRLLQFAPCTEEAKQCPDGSWVSRTDPNCEFAQCPGPPCLTVECLTPPCPCITCPGVNPCLKDGQCDTEARCFANPCHVVSFPCAFGQVCTADYCGGCGYKCTGCGLCMPQPDCSKVQCKQISCTTTEILVTPDRECCPICMMDCSKLSCLKPVCEAGYELVVDEGQCCPVCQPTCPDTETMEFVGCAGCPSTCERPNPICSLQCQAGCRCKAETPMWSEADGKCISAAECGPDCSVVRCAAPMCGEHEVEVTPAGACCAICESGGDKVECGNISDCDVGYGCKHDPKCRHFTGYEKLLCFHESATEKVCWRQQKHAFCPTDDCDEGYECVDVGITHENGICVDYQ